MSIFHRLSATGVAAAAVLGLTLTPRAQAQLFAEPFTYPDGDLSVVSGGKWQKIGTDTTPLNVSGGAAIINQASTTTGRADLGRSLGATLSEAAASQAFVSFNATWTSLPSNANGSYFAVFSTGPTDSTFYGRIGADRAGAATGKFRVSVANANWTQANSIEFPTDLSLNVAYHIVVRYDLSAKQTTLWVNPADVSSQHVTATDAVATQSDIKAFALRQGISSGTGTPGVIAIDDLVVGTSFAQLAPVPEPAEYAALTAVLLGGWAVLRRRRQA